MLWRFAALAALLASAAARNVARQETGGNGGDGEVDVTITETVTDQNLATVTASTVILKTVFSTIVVTKTDLTTETTTVKDVETATSTIYTTITQAAKRWIIVEPAPAPSLDEIPPPTLTADADAAETTTADAYNWELLVKKGIIVKRATIITTITLFEDGVTTVFNSKTSTVVSTTTSETTSVSTILTTEYENAKTTVTITSTILLKATTVTTGPAETVDSVPPDANIGDNTDGPSTPTGSTDSSSEDGGGLSTGAKAGIGAAAAVAGLAIIGGIIFFFYKRHKSKPHVVDDGTGMGMSEVPVGSIGPGGAASSRYSRTPETKPPLSSGGDWNPTGPAELGGTSKPPGAEMGGDELPRFPEANEADDRPVMGHNSGPTQPVYEMPAQGFR